MALPLVRILGGVLLRGSSRPDATNFKIRRTTNNIDKRVDKLQKEFGKIRQGAHEEFVRQTPIDTGNAKRKTELKGNQIQANYDYSIKLEKEAHSKQAPKGMSEPTIDWIREYLKRI